MQTEFTDLVAEARTQDGHLRFTEHVGHFMTDLTEVREGLTLLTAQVTQLRHFLTLDPDNPFFQAQLKEQDDILQLLFRIYKETMQGHGREIVSVLASLGQTAQAAELHAGLVENEYWFQRLWELVPARPEEEEDHAAQPGTNPPPAADPGGDAAVSPDAPDGALHQTTASPGAH